MDRFDSMRPKVIKNSGGGGSADYEEIYDWCEDVGAVIPADKTGENLLETIKSISEITYYTVTFNTDGGTAVADQVIVHGHTIHPDTYTMRSGYEFIGWETAEGEAYTTSTPIKKDVTLIAKWKSANVLLMNGSNSTSSYVLGYDRLGVNVPRNRCLSITFQMGGTPPETYGHRWDVSFDNNGTIMAYTDVTYSTNTSYNMTIYSTGTIELPEDCSYLFHGYGRQQDSIVFVNFDKLVTTNVKNMTGMFHSNYATYIDGIDNWDTSSVTNMASMFSYSRSLLSIDLNNWDVSNVTDMSYMFDNSANLKDVYISDWDTSNVTNMTGMFSKDTSLKNVDVSDWDVGKVIYFDNMFEKCSALTSIAVDNWDVKNARTLRSMFADCTSLTSIPCGGWNLADCRGSGYPYYGLSSFAAGCTSLTSLTIGISTNNVALSGLCKGCTNITKIDLSNLNQAAYVSRDYGNLAANCTSLGVLDMRNIQITKEPDGLSTMLTNVPTSCTIYVYDETARGIILKKWANHNVIAVETTE